MQKTLGRNHISQICWVDLHISISEVAFPCQKRICESLGWVPLIIAMCVKGSHFHPFSPSHSWPPCCSWGEGSSVSRNRGAFEARNSKLSISNHLHFFPWKAHTCKQGRELSSSSSLKTNTIFQGIGFHESRLILSDLK